MCATPLSRPIMRVVVLKQVDRSVAQLWHAWWRQVGRLCVAAAPLRSAIYARPDQRRLRRCPLVVRGRPFMRDPRGASVFPGSTAPDPASGRPRAPPGSTSARATRRRASLAAGTRPGRPFMRGQRGGSAALEPLRSAVYAWTTPRATPKVGNVCVDNLAGGTLFGERHTEITLMSFGSRRGVPCCPPCRLWCRAQTVT